VERSDGEAAYADRAMDGSEFDRAGYALDFQRGLSGGAVDQFAVKVFHNNIDHVMDNFSLRAADGMRRSMNPERATSGTRLAADLDIGEADAATVGLDYQYNEHTSRMAMAMMGEPSVEGLPRRDKADFNQFGAFGELEHVLSPAARLVTGLRVDRVEAQARQAASMRDPDGYGGAAPGQTDTDTNTSGFVRFERDLAAAPMTVYAGIGRAVRSPDFWERDRSFTLDSEQHTQLDAGAGYRAEKLRANAALFYADIDDYILITNNGDDAENISASIYGGEAGLTYSLAPQWELGATLSYVHGRNDTGDVPLAQMPPLEGSLTIDYRGEKYSAGLLLRAVADQDRLDVGDAEARASRGEQAREGEQGSGRGSSMSGAHRGRASRPGASTPASTISTGVPNGTRSKSSITSSLRMRMQPWDPGTPIGRASGQPWM